MNFSIMEYLSHLSLRDNLFPRCAGDKGRPGKSARLRCFVNCLQQASVEREIGLGRAGGIEDQRHDRQRDRGFGMATPSARATSAHATAALAAFAKASSIVLPIAVQPGRSGTTTP